MTYKCAICGFPIYGSSMGCGDGSGQDFAHISCYWKYNYELKCKEIEQLQAEHLAFIQEVNEGFDRINKGQAENRALRERNAIQVRELTDVIDEIDIIVNKSS